MDRVWDTSFKYSPKISVASDGMYLLKSSVTAFKVKIIQGYDVKETSSRTFLGLSVAIHVFGQLFVKNTTNDTRLLFEPPK